MADLTCIKTVLSEPEALVVCAFLRAEGIDAVITRKGGGTRFLLDVHVSAGFFILVPNEQKIKALDLLRSKEVRAVE